MVSVLQGLLLKPLLFLNHFETISKSINSTIFYSVSDLAWI